MASLETKLLRFERLAEKRVTEAVKKLRLIGNLANRHNYDYTESHVLEILEALESEVRHLRSLFRHETKGRKSVFSFVRKNSTKK